MILLFLTIRAGYYKIGHEKIADFWFEDEKIKELTLDLGAPESFDIQILLKIQGDEKLDKNICSSIAVNLKSVNDSINF